MKKKSFTGVLLILLSSHSFAGNNFQEQFVINSDETRQCYDIMVTAGIQNCMNELVNKKEHEKSEAYHLFLKKIKKNEGDIENPTAFISHIESSEKYYDLYVKNECAAFSYYETNDNSPAHAITYNHCLVSLYEKRIKFYKEYHQ
jgi:hypothetical protein